MKRFAISLCILAGCGGGDGSVSLSELSGDLAEAYCAQVFSCCTDAEIMEEFDGFDPPVQTQADCEQTYAGFVGAFLTAQAEASIEAGRMQFDGARADACLDQLRAASCAEFSGADPLNECQDPFVGTVANAGACVWDEECESNYCEGDSLFEETEGTCQPLPDNGDPCPDFTCAPGLYCEFDTEGDTCLPQKPDGTTCNFDDECLSDFCDTTCGPSTTCDGL